MADPNDRFLLDQVDPRIRWIVAALREEYVETFESCEGGEGHTFPEPAVRFHGDQSEGPRAFAAAKRRGIPVCAIRRYWRVIEGELTGPQWEMTFPVEALDWN